jgi:hypothetical protein
MADLSWSARLSLPALFRFPDQALGEGFARLSGSTAEFMDSQCLHPILYEGQTWRMLVMQLVPSLSWLFEDDDKAMETQH